MKDLSPEDHAFMTRLFGMRFPAGSTDPFRQALEWAWHIDVKPSDFRGKMMVDNLVHAILWRGFGDKIILGWELVEQDGFVTLGLLARKEKQEIAA